MSNKKYLMDIYINIGLFKKKSTNTTKFYNDLKRKMPIRNKIISSIRDEKINIYKIGFEDCLKCENFNVKTK